MSKLTVESAQDIIQDNRQILYHLPKRYEYLHYYLSRYKGTLYNTLLKVCGFIQDKEIIIYKHKYVFFLDNTTLTVKVRKKSPEFSSSSGTSSRHINLLCAIGLINKQYQSVDEEEYQLIINKIFLNSKQNEDGRKHLPINVFYFRRYTEKELNRLEERARLLFEAKVTSGNISYNYLMLNGLTEIGSEVYPNNNRTAPEKKVVEYGDLHTVMDMLIELNGYATKEQVKDNLLLEESEVDKLFKIFKHYIATEFDYKRPTKKQIEELSLQDKKYIFTRKEEQDAEFKEREQAEDNEKWQEEI